MPGAITRPNAFLVGSPPGGPAPPPGKAGREVGPAISYKANFSHGRVKAGTPVICRTEYFLLLSNFQFPIIGLGPYTVGVKIKDFNSGVGINRKTH